jgi:cell division protein FtsB
MFDFQQKRQIRKVIYSRVTLFVLFVLVILLGRATYDIYIKNQLSQTDYNSVKKEYDDLTSRQAMLDSEIARLNTQAGIEEEIRGRFSVAKPGEEIITVVDDESTGTPESSSDQSLWQKFTGLF